jgi:adenylate cyclase class 2
MRHEIEAKIKVPVLGPVADKLRELGAEFLHDVRQIDTYFTDTNKLLHKNDCGLRIRQEFTESRHSTMVTFKGARLQSRYKSRPEYETGISDAGTMEKIFESLGYAKRLTFEKKRAVWQISDCIICLDELPRLGCFVEVEGPDEETISGMLKKLNLPDEPHVTAGYASLMENELKLEGTQQIEVFLP